MKGKGLIHMLSTVVLSVILVACVDDELPVTTNTGTSGTETEEASREELTLDSMYLYASETYFWNEFLPEYDVFGPRDYNSGRREELDNLRRALFDLTQFAVDPETNRPFEFVSNFSSAPKYSFIEENEDFEAPLAAFLSSNLDGTAEDFGFALAAVGADDIRVRYVTKGSPAYEAGIRRGDRLVSVSGRSVRADSNADVSRIINAFENNTFDLTVEKMDGSDARTTLVKSEYTINPVTKQTIYDTQSGKVGYLAFESFTTPSNSEEVLNNAFSEFEKENISGIILDLRYNGGGFLSTADYLLNHIIPSSLNGKTMYIEEFNEQMQRGESSILENLPLKDASGDYIRSRGRLVTYADIDYSLSSNTFTFRKQGSLENISDVYVIISEETASASELLINTLRPYLNVTTIGSRSFGKPVGFFGIDIDRYTMFIPNFRTINADGESDYFDGFEPDIPAIDDVTRDFGNPEEASIAVALSLANENDFPLRQNMRMSTDDAPVKIGRSKGFNGMIENRTGSR